MLGIKDSIRLGLDWYTNFNPLFFSKILMLLSSLLKISKKRFKPNKSFSRSSLNIIWFFQKLYSQLPSIIYTCWKQRKDCISKKKYHQVNIRNVWSIEKISKSCKNLPGYIICNSCKSLFITLVWGSYIFSNLLIKIRVYVLQLVLMR